MVHINVLLLNEDDENLRSAVTDVLDYDILVVVENDLTVK